jgi:osmoprotectant transport system permease protein
MRDFIDAFDFMGSNPSLLTNKALDQLWLSGRAVALALAVALPIGLWLGHIHRGSFVAINVSNIGRALPSLALIAIGLGLFGIGSANVIVALVVLAVPPLITNSYLAIDQVDREVVEVARGTGMSEWQLFGAVELPLGIPFLFAGLRTAVLFVISTATLAAVAGGGGLGDIIINQASYRLSGVLAAAMWVAAIALAVDALLAILQRRLTPSAIRRGAGTTPGGRPRTAEARAGRTTVATEPAAAE